MSQRVGLVGAGRMGQGIGRNVLRHGHALSVLDHPGNQPLDELEGAGAVVVSSARELAARSEVVILCVTGAPQVESVLCDHDGVLAGLRPGALVIDCSTSLPQTSVRMEQRVRAAGGCFVDAPMTRTVADALAGRLNLLVGGAPDDVQAALAVLRCFAENIVVAGGVGAGHRLKLLHNFVSLGCIALVAEAAGYALGSGIDPQVFVSVLASGGGAGVALERLRPVIVDPQGRGMEFSMANALKDLGYYKDMVDASAAQAGIAGAVLQTLRGALATLGDEGAAVTDVVAALAARNRDRMQHHEGD